MGHRRDRHVQADTLHGHLEGLAILGRVDGLGGGADELRGARCAYGATFHELHGQVQRRLAAERRQHGVGPLAIDDAAQHISIQRLHVGGRRELRVGHDRGRVGVGQDHPVALFTEHLAGLGARVVELACLSDHDGPRPDQQDRLDVVAARHQATPRSAAGYPSGASRRSRTPSMAAKSSKR